MTDTPKLRGARELLASEVGCPVSSDYDLDLGARDQVFTEAALRAIGVAQREAAEAYEQEIRNLRGRLEAAETSRQLWMESAVQHNQRAKALGGEE